MPDLWIKKTLSSTLTALSAADPSEDTHLAVELVGVSGSSRADDLIDISEPAVPAIRRNWEFRKLMFAQGRQPNAEKFLTFFNGKDSVGELEKSLGLDIREVMCCASKASPAVVYHRPYGLILEGETKVMFNDDSGVFMLPDGTYTQSPLGFTKEIDLQTLMTEWYNRFERSPNFVFNEAVLKKGAKIVGAFHDPSFDPESLMYVSQCSFGVQEPAAFLEKVERLSLDLVTIDAKFK